MTERSIFLAAVDIADPVQRAAYLDQACHGNTKLRQHIDELIAATAKLGSFLDRPHIDVAATADMEPQIAERPGSQIGPYKLLQQIGEGGMGVVYMAEQMQPVHRRVALKIVKPGLDSRQVIARFEAERQALALMDHLNIAKVLDAGATAIGRPFFVMELVHGVPITKYCDDNHLSPRQRLDLFIPVCHAIQHAHQKGIIHRDIKPSNVLVCLYDGKPVAKVIDFGVAKAIEQRLTERTLFTQYGNIIGTFEYMSPEQAEMSQLGIDTRSDIYSLGVLLYELLTGTTPLDRQRLRSAALDEMLRMIREEEPPKPSTRISGSESLPGVAASRNTEPAKLARLVRGDLDWIVMKCLEKDRTRRYETANGLARDVSRYLSDEPVEACPPSTVYRLKKLIHRNKGPVAAATLVLLTLLIGIVGTTWGLISAERSRQAEAEQRRLADKSRQAEMEQRQQAEAARERETARAEAEARERQRAEAAEMTARDNAEQASRERDEANRQRKQVTTLNATLKEQQERQRRQLYVSDMNRIQIAWARDNVTQMQELLNAHRPHPGHEDLRGFEWHYWNRLLHADLRTLQVPRMAAGNFNEQGTRLVTWRTGAPEIVIWNTDRGERVLRLRETLGPGFGTVHGFRVQSGRIAFVSTQASEVFDITSGRSLLRIPFRRSSSTTTRIAMNAQGTQLAVFEGGLDREQDPFIVKLWDIDSGTELSSISLDELVRGTSTWTMNYIELDAGGQRMAISFPSPVQSIQVFNVSTGRQLASIPGLASRLRFSPDGTRLAAVVRDYNTAQDRLAVFDADNSFHRLFAAGSEVSPEPAPLFSPDGQWLAYSGSPTGRVIQLVDARTGAAGPKFVGHTARIKAIAFQQDSGQIVSCDESGAVKFWPLLCGSPDRATLVIGGSAIGSVSYDGTRIATAPGRPSGVVLNLSNAARLPGAPENRVTIRDASGRVLHETSLLDGPITSLSIGQGGRRVVVSAAVVGEQASVAGDVRVFEMATGREQLKLRFPFDVDSTIATTPRTELREGPPAVLSPREDRLAVAVFSGMPSKTAPKVWNVDLPSAPPMEFQSIDFPVRTLMWSPDGKLLAGGNLRSIRPSSVEIGLASRLAIWDTQTGQLAWELREPGTYRIESASFHPSLPIVFGFVQRHPYCFLKTWDVGTGRELSSLPLPQVRVSSSLSYRLAFSHDGQKVATAPVGRDIVFDATNTISVWNLTHPEQPALVLDGQIGAIVALAFSPDDRRLVSSSDTGSGLTGQTKIWDANTGDELLTDDIGANVLRFNENGKEILGSTFLTGGAVRLLRWNAASLPAVVEGRAVVEMLLSRAGADPPLNSELITQIEADGSLAPDAKEAAISLVRQWPRTDDLLIQTRKIVDNEGLPRERYARALAWATDACSLQPDRETCWNARVWAHHRLSQPVETIAALERLCEACIQQGQSLLAEELAIGGIANHQLGKINEARQALNKVRVSASRNETRYKPLLARLETLLEIPPASASPADWIGKQFMPRLGTSFVGNDDKPITQGLPFTISQVEGDRLWTGVAWVKRTDVIPLDSTLEYFAHAIQASPSAPGPYNDRGIVWKEKGQLDKAIEDYTEAIRLGPNNAWSYSNRGYAWAAKGDLDKAIADFTEAIRLDPNYEFALSGRRDAFRRRLQYEQAIADTSELIRLQPRSGARFAARADLYSRKRDFDRAIADYDEAIRLTPQGSWYYANRASVWMQMELPDKALQDYDEAIRLDPKLASAYISRGELWRLKGHDAQSDADWEEASRLNPITAAIAYFNRSNTEYGKQEYVSALKDSARAVALWPQAFYLDGYARKLATCPDDKYRNGMLAVELATKACELTQWKNAMNLDTLAAACAEVGDFTEAVKWQEQAKLLASEAGQADYDTRLQLYREGKPYRTVSKTE